MAKGRGAKNLAALAAVGALGYNLGKGIYKKPGEKLADVERRGEDKEPEVDVPKTSTVAAPSLTNKTAPSEVQESVFTGPMNPLVNELGEPYSTTPSLAVTAPRRATRPAVPAVAPTVGTGSGRGMQGGPSAEELDAYAKLKRGAGAGRGIMGGPSADELAAYREQQRMDKLRSSGGMRAKGGVIKAKKMASGGAVSASKRGDGIAVRGKTKGKIY